MIDAADRSTAPSAPGEMPFGSIVDLVHRLAR
jgi:hypothetical protein